MLLVGADLERLDDGGELLRRALEAGAVEERGGIREAAVHERPEERLREAAHGEARDEAAPLLHLRDERHERRAGGRLLGRLGDERAVLAEAREEEPRLLLLVLEERLLLAFAPRGRAAAARCRGSRARSRARIWRKKNVRRSVRMWLPSTSASVMRTILW